MYGIYRTKQYLAYLTACKRNCDTPINFVRKICAGVKSWTFAPKTKRRFNTKY